MRMSWISLQRLDRGGDDPLDMFKQLAPEQVEPGVVAQHVLGLVQQPAGFCLDLRAHTFGLGRDQPLVRGLARNGEVDLAPASRLLDLPGR